jgi:hypothetical protein
MTHCQDPVLLVRGLDRQRSLSDFVRVRGSPPRVILPGTQVAGSVRVRRSLPMILPGAWVAGSMRVRGSPPMIHPGALVAGSYV